MQTLTPQAIVEELDRFIIGQAAAKRAVAVAIRNRWRRRQLDQALARDIWPKNIIMMGPTGVGKTEIARRLATLAGAPFIKVEASKFTEVGYHGRDVESMVRDLVEAAIRLVREEQAERVREQARDAAVERLVDLILPKPGISHTGAGTGGAGQYVPSEDAVERREQSRARVRDQILAGRLDEREVEITIAGKPSTQLMFANMGLDQMDPDMAGMFEKLIPEQTRTRRLPVGEAREILIEQETEKLLDKDKITSEAIERAGQDGIVFLDEIDKIATPSGPDSAGRGGPDVSRQGVQRDLLPIVEGSTVNTRYGPVQTDHVLFIAAGAFHTATVSDLMPELQGRFPIRVELTALGQAEFVRILTEPHNALTRQQERLLAVEGLTVTFEPTAIDAMAELAARANASMENIGARRLMTVMEQLFDQINFDAPERVARGETELAITEAFVREQVTPIIEDEDLSKFVL